MFIKTALALTAALAVTTSTAALAQHGKRYDRYPVYRTAPAALDGDYTGVTNGEPKSFGAGHIPRAFYDQQQPGYPQSPPGGGE